MKAIWAAKKNNAYEITHIDAGEFDEAILVLDAVLNSEAPRNNLSGEMALIPAQDHRLLVGNQIYRMRRDSDFLDRCPAFEKCPYPHPSMHHPSRNISSLGQVSVCWRLLGRWGIFHLVKRENPSKPFYPVMFEDRSEANSDLEYQKELAIAQTNMVEEASGEKVTILTASDLAVAFFWCNGAPAFHHAVGFYIPTVNSVFYSEFEAKTSFDCYRWMDAIETEEALSSEVVLPCESSEKASNRRL